MTGRETGLATPVEDMMNLAAVNNFLFRRRRPSERGTGSGTTSNSRGGTTNNSENDVIIVVGGGVPRNNSKTPPPVVPLPLEAVAIVPMKKWVFALGTTVDVGHGIDPQELDARLLEMANSGTMAFYEALSLPALPSSTSSSSSSSQAIKLSTPTCTSVTEDPAAAAVYNHDSQADAQFFHDLIMGGSSQGAGPSSSSLLKPETTIVQSLVCAAMAGHRGYYTPPHLVQRLGNGGGEKDNGGNKTGNRVCLSAQTATLFGFNMEKLAMEILYLDQVSAGTDVCAMCGIVKRQMDAADAEREKGKGG